MIFEKELIFKNAYNLFSDLLIFRISAGNKLGY